MPQAIIDELSQADEAFAGNRLLSTFADKARALLEGPALHSRGATVREDAAVYALEICRLSLPALRI